MKVTGQLKEPVLDPCPNRDDIQNLVDDECRPAVCTRPRNGDQGLDCCHYWTAPDTWEKARVRVDQIDAEKFKYDQYRYQLYAKPVGFDCRHGVSRLERVPDRQYIPPVTDIRALRQTTVVPIIPGAGAPGVGAGGAGIPFIPSNPGGVPEVTFPMTPGTLGQPDVTTACCVPVVPCQQGYQNLTPNVRGTVRCTEPPPPGAPLQQLGPQRPDTCAAVGNCDLRLQQQKQLQHRPGQAPPPACQELGCGTACGPAPQQYVMPPSNQQGTCCGGLPPTFPQAQRAYGAANVSQLNVPKPEFPGEGHMGQVEDQGQGQDSGCFDTQHYCVVERLEDGLHPMGGADTACTNVSTFRYRDRVMRDYDSVKETPDERRKRLTRMSGAYGAALQPKQSSKRNISGPKDNIILQGNGFSWGGYPKHENRLCYVLERNNRC